MTEGIKADTGKLPWHLLPFDAVGDVVEVLKHGAEKYGDRNWEKGMDHSRVFSAALRHMVAYQSGEDADAESGLSHLAHAATNLLFLSAYRIRGVGTDDRASVAPSPAKQDETDALKPCSECLHRNGSASDEPCASCIGTLLRPNWEPMPEHAGGYDCDTCEHAIVSPDFLPCAVCQASSRWVPKEEVKPAPTREPNPSDGAKHPFCNTCRYANIDIDADPCRVCLKTCEWEPKP